MRKLATYDRRCLIAIGVTLSLATAAVGWLRSHRNMQVFDLPVEEAILTPEWADNQRAVILRTEFVTRPVLEVGLSSTRITVTKAMTMKVRERDSTPSVNCCDERECSGRWAAATASDETEAVWWKQEGRWLPSFQYSGHGPRIISSRNRGSTLELPGAALGTLPDGRFVYAETDLPGTNTAIIDAWGPQSADVQHVGKVHFPTGTQIFSARMSPDGQRIGWLTYDSIASDNGVELISRSTRAFRRFTGKPLPAICVVAWLSNLEGGDLHAVTRIQESGMLILKYTPDYDEYIGPTGDEISWSCDSKFFAFIRGNPRGKRQLYVCRAD